ncbi:MAG TPA: hypothetical protein VFU35_08460 [Jatrophihabitans sp.]|nr:hypothetical protein [Jatrophihabitans sp.]
MSAQLHRIEALPGRGRYAVTFRRADGGEQTATATVGDAGVEVAESALPAGWRRDGTEWQAVAAALTAFDGARRSGRAAVALQDVPGGWDVSLGNVVLDDAGRPACTAHGPLAADVDGYVCAECGARALLG